MVASGVNQSSAEYRISKRYKYKDVLRKQLNQLIYIVVNLAFANIRRQNSVVMGTHVTDDVVV